MALGLTQSIVKMSTRNISWGRSRPVREADDLTTFMCQMSWKYGSLNVLERSGPHRACYGILLPLPTWECEKQQSKVTYYDVATQRVRVTTVAMPTQYSDISANE